LGGLEEAARKLAGMLDHVISLMLSGELERMLAQIALDLEGQSRSVRDARGAQLHEAATRLELLAQYTHALRLRYQRYGARNIYREADYVSSVIMEVVELLRRVEATSKAGGVRGAER